MQLPKFLWMADRLAPGSTIGILGGGQLGRMLSLAAARLGLKTHVFDPDPDAPAKDVTAFCTTAAYTDEAALKAFGNAADVITYEFENIPTAALDILEPLAPIRPTREALRISQDRITEKDFLNSLGLKIAPYRAVDTLPDLEAAMAEIGLPAILKTRRFGYDGKGQARITNTSEAPSALASLKGAPAILEGFIDFSREVSVIGTRALSGAVACFDPGENVHENGILATTTLPSHLTSAETQDAVLLAGRILNALDYVGTLGVELFVTKIGLIVNEIAPRVHNSGHWTEAACTVDQFEQHIRAVAGWPLGDGSRHSNAVMENLIGDDIKTAPDTADAMVNIYGKAEARPGRKMGHITRISPKG